jgi:hypothetical protein
MERCIGIAVLGVVAPNLQVRGELDEACPDVPVEELC